MSRHGDHQQLERFSRRCLPPLWGPDPRTMLPRLGADSAGSRASPSFSKLLLEKRMTCEPPYISTDLKGVNKPAGSEAQAERRERISWMPMAAAAPAFREEIRPRTGIETVKSQDRATKGRIPLPSPPITMEARSNAGRS